MALGDIPKIPPEYRPRVQKLYDKIKTDEITIEEILTNILTVLGKISIDYNGIKIAGSYGAFEIDSRFVKSAQELLLALYPLWPVALNMRFLIKRGDKFTKVTFGFLRSRATKKDINNPKLPVIEFTNPEPDFFQDIRNYALNALSVYLHHNTEPEPTRQLFKVHRVEEVAGWLGAMNGWNGLGKLFKVSVPLFPLITKEVLDELGESMTPFCDHVLKKCGV